MFQYVSELDVGVQTQSRFVSDSYDSLGRRDIGNIKDLFLSSQVW
jgi:hypothetical protein